MSNPAKAVVVWGEGWVADRWLQPLKSGIGAGLACSWQAAVPPASHAAGEGMAGCEPGRSTHWGAGSRQHFVLQWGGEEGTAASIASEKSSIEQH